MAKKNDFTKPASDGKPLSKSQPQREHFQSLVDHTLESAQYNGHGHLEGKQGHRGHDMPDSTAHLQGGAHIPAKVISRLPANNQNSWSDGAGCANASDQTTSDYATTDDKGN
jgi:hypothetical protein